MTVYKSASKTAAECTAATYAECYGIAVFKPQKTIQTVTDPQLLLLTPIQPLVKSLELLRFSTPQAGRSLVDYCRHSDVETRCPLPGVLSSGPAVGVGALKLFSASSRDRMALWYGGSWNSCFHPCLLAP